MPDKASHTTKPGGSLLTVLALILVAILAGLLAYALPGYRIGTIDEPWIAEQAYHLASDGVVRSTMFTGYADNETQIFVYHKLLVWLAALVIKAFGLKLWLLRMISLISGLLLFRTIFLYLKHENAERVQFLLTVLFLLACPLFFMRIFVFRPEFLATFLGFASFYLLIKTLRDKSSLSLCLGGAAAGLSMLAHLNGVIFIVAGLVLLLAHRRYFPSLGFALIALVVASLYFVDALGHWGVLVNQFVVSPAHPTRSLNPGVALTNLLEEHKRLFRRPDIIGLSLLYVLSLLYRWLVQKRFWSAENIYTLTLVIALGLINANKTPTYAMLIFPFMALSLASVVVELFNKKALPKLVPIGSVMIVVYLGWGLYANATTALTKREYPAQRHQQVASRLTEGAAVVAPLKFMFNEIDHFDIRAFEALHLIVDEKQKPFTIANMEQYAVGIRAEYLIFDCEFENDLGYPVSYAMLDSLTIYTPVDSVAGYRIYRFPNATLQR